MKILHVVYNSSTHSGAAFQAQQLAAALDSKFNICSSFLSIETSSQAGRALKRQNVTTVEYKGLFGRFKSIFSFLFMVNKFDVVHFHGFFLFNILLCCAIGKPFVLKTTLLGKDDFSTLEKKYGKRIVKSISNSKFYNNALTEEIYKSNLNFLDSNKIANIPNGIDMSIVGAKSRRSATENQFCYIGAIVPRKRVLEIVDFFQKTILPVFPEARLVVAGPDGLGLAEGSADYTKQVFDKFSSCNVDYRGQVEQEDALKIIRDSKGMLLFSKSEGLANVLIESLALRTVPIIGNIAGMSSGVVRKGYDAVVLTDDEIKFSSPEFFYDEYKRVHNILNCKDYIFNYDINKSARRHYDVYVSLRG